MQFNPAISKFGEVLTRYVHTGNKVIQPISVDLTTGLFTTDTSLLAMGYSINQKVNCITVPHSNIRLNYIPREMKSADSPQIEIVSDTTFYLLVSNVRLTYPHAGNVSINPTWFHFETHFPNSVELNTEGLPFKRWRVRFRGNRGRAGWTYVYYNIVADDGTLNNNFGTFSDGRNLNSLYFELFIQNSPTANMVLGQVDKLIVTTWADTTGLWTTSHSTNNLGTGLSVKATNPKLTYLRFQFDIANGSVIEILDEGV